MYKFFRPLLFKISKDPEAVHHLALSSLKFGGVNFIKPLWSWVFKYENEKLEQKAFGINFKNPVGLAAGFDKEGEAVSGLEALGFGFLELGTVTKIAQSGNSRPRIFRLAEDGALINRMGFNNNGADSLSEKKLDFQKIKIPLGVSLGKSKVTELSLAVEDYLYSFSKTYDCGSYFAVNISSPNTPGLRQLQDKKYLLDILSALNNFRKTQKIVKPILVKIVIDFTLDAVDEILEVCKTCAIDGIIVSNTTLSRDVLKAKIDEVGGLSGLPIKNKSTVLIKYIHKKNPNLPIIGVGGIFSAVDAYEKIKAGASLVQIYTGLIYEGPGLIRSINKGLVKLLEQDGFKNISEAVGVKNN